MIDTLSLTRRLRYGCIAAMISKSFTYAFWYYFRPHGRWGFAHA
jgi:hypothetical protein